MIYLYSDFSILKPDWQTRPKNSLHFCFHPVKQITRKIVRLFRLNNDDLPFIN